MAEPQAHQPKGLGLPDVIFMLLRHKWKIAMCGTGGILLAAGMYFTTNPGYKATAKLLVRYVAESPSPMSGDAQQSVRSTAGRTESILVSERHIITSLDIAAEVARDVGPSRILLDETESTNFPAAVHAISKGLVVEIPQKQTRILQVRFGHPDPDTAKLVLQEVLDRYMERHLELHRAIGAYEFLARQTDRLRARLAQTDDELRRLKAKANIVSLEDSRAAVHARLRETKSALDESAAELAAREERFRQWTEIFQTGGAGDETNAPASADPAMVADYTLIVEHVAELKRKHQRLSSIYTASNALVRLVRDQIGEQLDLKRKFEQAHPEVLNTALIGSGEHPESVMDPAIERAEVSGLKAKNHALRTQYQEALEEAEAIAAVEPDIVKLERSRKLDEENYRNFSASLEQARIDEALDPTKMPNISRVQEPTVSKGGTSDLKKTCLMIVMAGFGLGVGLAFLIELVIDQTFKRPEDVENQLPLPVLLSIPLLSRQEQLLTPMERLASRLGWPFKRRRTRGVPAGSVAEGELSLITAAGVPSGALKAYCEAVRDRMMLFFKLKNMVHKPKLVAVTGCSSGAGGSTLATGLAASLSETGGGKVLLVDMNLGKGAVHPFYQGGPDTALRQGPPEESLEEQKVTENLYVASPEDPRHRQALMLPRKFGDLIPGMRASDYDYIIFDMPPVSQTAASLTLSSYMDQVLLVIEAGKSSKETVRRASSLLQQGGTNVFGVFNKSTSTQSGWLQPKL